MEPAIPSQLPSASGVQGLPADDQGATGTVKQFVPFPSAKRFLRVEPTDTPKRPARHAPPRPAKRSTQTRKCAPRAKQTQVPATPPPRQGCTQVAERKEVVFPEPPEASLRCNNWRAFVRDTMDARHPLLRYMLCAEGDCAGHDELHHNQRSPAYTAANRGTFEPWTERPWADGPEQLPGPFHAPLERQGCQSDGCTTENALPLCYNHFRKHVLQEVPEPFTADPRVRMPFVHYVSFPHNGRSNPKFTTRRFFFEKAVLLTLAAGGQSFCSPNVARATDKELFLQLWEGRVPMGCCKHLYTNTVRVPCVKTMLESVYKSPYMRTSDFIALLVLDRELGVFQDVRAGRNTDGGRKTFAAMSLICNLCGYGTFSRQMFGDRANVLASFNELMRRIRPAVMQSSLVPEGADTGSCMPPK